MDSLANIVEGRMLLVNKPSGWTSFDVVNKIRYAIRSTFQIKKIKVGHAGTLDPLATGLLIICTGKMTKQIHTYQDQKKIYTGIFQLGATTPTYDSESEVDKKYPFLHIKEEDVSACSSVFEGDISQKPPIFSAIKKDGVRLYKLARAKKEVKIEPRPVHIDYLRFTDFDLPYVSFEVKCSKGTYIRSLAFDIGHHLKSGAFLTKLVRTHIGDYNVADAWELDNLITEINALPT